MKLMKWKLLLIAAAVFAFSGPANAPRLELTSEPPMDTAEIISYVFFGRSQSDSSSGQSSGIETTAASVAGVMLVDSLAPELRESLRIDQISVTSGDADEAPAVEIETQLTPDVHLRLIQFLGGAGDEAVEVRWRFWRNFNFESQVARSGASSIDLLWAYDFWGLQMFGLQGLRAPPPPYRSDAQLEPEPVCRPPEICPE